MQRTGYSMCAYCMKENKRILVLFVYIKCLLPVDEEYIGALHR